MNSEIGCLGRSLTGRVGARNVGATNSLNRLGTSSSTAQRQCDGVRCRRRRLAFPLPRLPSSCLSPSPRPPGPTISQPLPFSIFAGTIRPLDAGAPVGASGRGGPRARCRWRWEPGGTGTAGRFGRAGPWERAIHTRFDDTPPFVQCTVTVGSIPGVWRDRLPGCGAALPVQGPSGFPGCRKDIHTGYLNQKRISFGILDI